MFGHTLVERQFIAAAVVVESEAQNPSCQHPTNPLPPLLRPKKRQTNKFRSVPAGFRSEVMRTLATSRRLILTFLDEYQQQVGGVRGSPVIDRVLPGRQGRPRP